MPKTIILGAGLVGSVLASFLAREGCEVEVFERMPDPRRVIGNAGRSINLTLCKRGLDVLDAIGAGDEVRAISVPVHGRMIHDIHGGLTFQPYGNHREAIYSIGRRDLNRTLLQFAERAFSVPFHFNKKCMEVDLASPSLEIKNLMSGEVTRKKAEWIFGADGVHSPVRCQMQKKMRFNFWLQYWEQGYKEMPVPPSNADWTSEKNAIHIWPRGNYMLIGFPNTDQSFTCSLHLPFEGPHSFESIKTEEDLRKLFRESFPDVVDFMPGLVENFLKNPTNPMVTIKCSPWSYEGKVAILGDAAHSIYPSYGQGANAGFEDCAVLCQCMKEQPANPTALLRDFEDRRRPNTDAIADLCVEHFKELRDLVGTPRFLLRKQIERKINDLYPAEYQDLYSMISFTSMLYTEALQIDREQRAIVDQLMEVAGIDTKLDSHEVARLIEDLMTKRLSSLAVMA
jgi:kynurenine 3-monooxygenase